MTTQPKLPEWAEQLLKSTVSYWDGSPVIHEKDVRTLASRLIAEIVPVGRKDKNDALDRIEFSQTSRQDALAVFRKANGWRDDAISAINMYGEELARFADHFRREGVKLAFGVQPDPGPAAEPSASSMDYGNADEITLSDPPTPKQAEGGGKS